MAPTLIVEGLVRTLTGQAQLGGANFSCGPAIGPNFAGPIFGPKPHLLFFQTWTNFKSALICQNEIAPISQNEITPISQNKIAPISQNAVISKITFLIN